MRRFYLLPKVDLYVVRLVLGMMAMGAVAICLLVAVVDAFQRMDEFVEFARREEYGALATTWLVVQYYVCLTPQYFLLYMVPFVSMLAGVSVVAVMSSHREFTALRASGVPLQRVLLPVVLTVLAIGAGVFLTRDAFLPSLARWANAVSLKLRPRGGRAVTVVLRRDGEVATYCMGHFDPVRRVAHNFRLEVRDWQDWRAGRTGRFDLHVAADAQLAGGVWHLGTDARHLRVGPGGQPSLPVEDIPTRVTPAMLEQATLGLSVMTSDDLQALSADITKVVELARRRAAPLAGVSVLLVGMSLLLLRERSNPGSQVGRVKSIIYAILVTAAYYGLQGVCLNLAEAQHLGPNLAAWIPNLAFGSVGGYTFWKVNL
jgi:lipopolysaccharide export LptBFGC system permease protein LptF